MSGILGYGRAHRPMARGKNAFPIRLIWGKGMSFRLELRSFARAREAGFALFHFRPSDWAASLPGATGSSPKRRSMHALRKLWNDQSGITAIE